MSTVLPATTTLPTFPPFPANAPRRLADVGASSSAKSFWVFMARVARVGGFVHLCFIGMFWAVGAWMLALVNVGSVLLLAAAYQLLRRRRNTLALYLIGGEIGFHAVMAVRTIGWDSGFHYYLLLVVPVVAVSRMARAAKLAAPIAVGVVYVALEQLMRNITPIHSLDAHLMAGLRIANVMTSIGLLAYLGRLYSALIVSAEHRLRDIAATDPLTRLYNRHRIAEVLQYEATRTKRTAMPLAIVLADIDHFKVVNDRHGHDCGDLVLVAISDVLRATVREQDSVARWGGEEFLIVMPHTSQDEAARAAERIRQAVRQAQVVSGEGMLLDLTVTLGVAMVQAGENMEATIARADQALYQGKQDGRDRVVQASH